ncbi:hypothetical protein LXA43DRAFT_1069825 [Ganoderma leucocontextum]|nr:hypothetical protein LXA43DRAFT_1069825 [Ganoderma leucocontextum]
MSPKILAGVVGIMVKLCRDHILREKLYKQGLLDKVVELIHYSETCYVALQILLHFTCYNGPTSQVILEDISFRNGTLSRFVRDHSADPRAIEMAVAVMSHATRLSLSSSSSTDKLSAEDIAVVSASRTILEVLRNPQNHRPSLLTHALQFLILPTDRFPEECKGLPSLLTLLVAFLRSKDSGTRTLSMIGLLNIYQADAEPDQHDVELRNLGDALRGRVPQPDSFRDMPRQEFLRSLEYSYTASLYRTTMEYFTAMAQAARDRDFCTLGHKLADLFQQSPSSIEAPCEQFQRVTDVSPTPYQTFSLCSDVVLGCARALRVKGSARDCVAADILELKFLLMRNRLNEAISLGTRVLEREPNLAFAYYIVSLGNHPEHSLRAAKAGLDCPDLTPFLRQHMLWRAIDLSTRRAFAMMLRPGVRTRDIAACEESEILVREALEDAQTLIDEMPPDTPLLMTILGWAIILTFIIHGNRLNETLGEIKPFLRRITMTTDLMRYFGYSVNKTDIYMTWRVISRTYVSSFEEWGSLVNSYDECDTEIGHIEPEGSGCLTLDKITPMSVVRFIQCSVEEVQGMQEGVLIRLHAKVLQFKLASCRHPHYSD